MNKKKIEAKIIAYSINPQGDRITTYLLTYPRFIHSELMTHRVFSRNSASSRAIPFQKMVKMIEEDPFIPIAWQKNHKGMQGTEYLTDIMDIERAEHRWRMSIANNIDQAKVLNDGIGVTKQLCNRLLEPFMWHTVLLTATEFENFFKLRCPEYHYKGRVFKSKKDMLKANLGTFPTKLNDLEWIISSKSQAEIHIQALAEAMWDAMNDSTPKELKTGEWHIPFGDKINDIKLLSIFDNYNNMEEDIQFNTLLEYKIKVATARCARLSYMTFDNEIDYQKDIELHDTLLESGHASPFEHVCRVLTNEEYESCGKIIPLENGTFEFQKGWVDNFRGYKSYRRILNI